ncbi:MAG: HAMP domain-containing histidine kinase [Verrucomicrobia bacterium]|nr:HAMP domain-containing histidine kinase [Verrucomicrobiota bacterium]
MSLSRSQLLKRLPTLFEIPAPDPERARRRIEVMERNTMLAVKVVFIGIILHSFNYRSPWMNQISSNLDVTVETVQLIFSFYVLLNILLATPLLAAARMPLALLQWTVVTSSLTDGLLLAGMTLITGGLDSVLFWLFIGLILRNSVSVPPGFSQLFLNFAISLCYAVVAVLDASIMTNLDDTTRRALDLMPHEETGEPFFLRLLVLWLMTITCYGVQAFLEKQRLAVEEAAEFAAREGQLRSAGRLAAEFAHQIKNPLAIIRNAAHSLERSVREDKKSAAQQIEIIQEEVAHADKVITQIMGYAQLSEGRVEKLGVAHKLNEAIEQVFPAAVPTGTRVEKNLTGPFPPLLMQRGHLSEIFLNLLQNAREALDGRGVVTVTARTDRDNTVEISVADDGPGIAPDKLGRIFEAYFTTKEKGTGLGLAIVKHNAELYGGTVHVESVLGNGAKFIVTFPAKSLPKPFKK